MKFLKRCNPVQENLRNVTAQTNKAQGRTFNTTFRGNL